MQPRDRDREFIRQCRAEGKDPVQEFRRRMCEINGHGPWLPMVRTMGPNTPPSVEAESVHKVCATCGYTPND